MFANPFMPNLAEGPAGNPGEETGLLFGRRELLRDFDRAVEVAGSPVRFLILTGQHGIGKTALVRRLSQKAVDAGWDIFDVNSVARLDMPADPYSEVSLYDLDFLLREACLAAEKGVFIAVDDVQNLPIENISLVCNAVQMVSRKGLDVALVLAGLPHVHGDVIQYDGCSFMRRATHEVLTLLTPEEVEAEFANAFGQVKGLVLDPAALRRLVAMSSGHPYMMRLLGYHVVDLASRRAAGDASAHVSAQTYRVTEADAEEIYPAALAAYERNLLEPLLDELCAAAHKPFTCGFAEALESTAIKQ